MRLYLIQHGEALEKEADPERPLSDQGVRNVTAMAGHLWQLRLEVPTIWHSGILRAQQTAEILAAALGGSAKVKAAEDLEPKSPVGKLAKRLTAREKDLAIVGHLPHLGKLASLLLSGEKERVAIGFERSGVLCLERGGDGGWAIRWMLVPSILPK